MGSSRERNSTVPMAEDGSMGVNTKWLRGDTHTTSYLSVSTTCAPSQLSGVQTPCPGQLLWSTLTTAGWPRLCSTWHVEPVGSFSMRLHRLPNKSCRAILSSAALVQQLPGALLMLPESGPQEQQMILYVIQSAAIHNQGLHDGLVAVIGAALPVVLQLIPAG